MARRTIKVFRDGDVWVVQRDGASKASAIRNTKKEAYEAARDIALNQGLTITIHHKGKKRIVNPQDREEGCFLTTACVKYYGLNDNCHQLQTLRNFRDNYLLRSKANQKLVQEYYAIAPALVQLLETDKNKSILFNEIFEKINCACVLIEKKDFTKAKDIYIDAVSKLMHYFK